MDSSSVVQSIVQNLVFKVEATPQNNVLECISTTSWVTPLDIKIKVRKKNKSAIQEGILSVPKFNQPGVVPKRIRLISSDRTVMSFDMLVEADIEQKYTRKVKKKNRHQFFGGCFSTEYDQDDYPYIKKSTHTAKSSNDTNNISRSDNVIKQSTNIGKRNIEENNNTNPTRFSKKGQRNYFGKCKGGGCLDPPFGEDKYSYGPKNKRLFSSSKECNELKINQTKPNDKKKSIINRTKEENVRQNDICINKLSDTVGNKTSVLSILSLYQAQFMKNSIDSKYSDSIITYPPTVFSSENINEKYLNERNKPCGNISRKSYNEFTETYFIPPIRTKNNEINNDASITNLSNKRLSETIVSNVKIQTELCQNSTNFVKPLEIYNDTMQTGIANEINLCVVDQRKKDDMYKNTVVETITNTYNESLALSENIKSNTITIIDKKSYITKSDTQLIVSNITNQMHTQKNNKEIQEKIADAIKDINQLPNLINQVQINKEDVVHMSEMSVHICKEIIQSNNKNNDLKNNKKYLKDIKLKEIYREQQSTIIDSQVISPYVINQVQEKYTFQLNNEEVKNILEKSPDTCKELIQGNKKNEELTNDKNHFKDSKLKEIYMEEHNNVIVEGEVILQNLADRDNDIYQVDNKEIDTMFEISPDTSKDQNRIQSTNKNDEFTNNQKHSDDSKLKEIFIDQQTIIVDNQIMSPKLISQLKGNYISQLNIKEVENMIEKKSSDTSNNKKERISNANFLENINLEEIYRAPRNIIIESQTKLLNVQDSYKSQECNKKEKNMFEKSPGASVEISQSNYNNELTNDIKPSKESQLNEIYTDQLNIIEYSQIIPSNVTNPVQNNYKSQGNDKDEKIMFEKSPDITTEIKKSNKNELTNDRKHLKHSFEGKFNEIYIKPRNSIINIQKILSNQDQAPTTDQYEINIKYFKNMLENTTDTIQEISPKNNRDDKVMNDKIHLKDSNSLVQQNTVINGATQNINDTVNVNTSDLNNFELISSTTLKKSFSSVKSVPFHEDHLQNTLYINSEAEKSKIVEQHIKLSQSSSTSNFDDIDTKAANVKQLCEIDIQSKTKINNVSKNNSIRITHHNINEIFRNIIHDNFDISNTEYNFPSIPTDHIHKNDFSMNKKYENYIKVSNKNSNAVNKYGSQPELPKQVEKDDTLNYSDVKQENANHFQTTATSLINGFTELDKSKYKKEAAFNKNGTKFESSVNASLPISPQKSQMLKKSSEIHVNFAFQLYESKNRERILISLDESRLNGKRPEDNITLIKCGMKSNGNEIKIPIDSKYYISIRLKTSTFGPGTAQRNESTHTERAQDVLSMKLNEGETTWKSTVPAMGLLLINNHIIYNQIKTLNTIRYTI
ncbi:protein PF3D7_1417600-like [Achroia grisella]|uniref:protein PF3D7_1417600-like n=1 Tax=Achroia grisella TaxID=688607 RepID=UPI0027D1F117|nr:protein PF3D7_1417600-like [Achroia grisella]